MKRIATVLILFAAIFAPVFAADEGAYAGVQVGWGHYTFSDTPNSVTDYGIRAGYHFNKNLAVEGGYTRFGSTNSSLTSTGYVQAYAINVSALGIIPFGEAFSAYGRYGLASVTTDVGSGLTFGRSKTGVTFGIGAQYKLNQQVGFRLGLDQYKIDSAAGVTANINDVNLAAIFKY